MPPGVSAADLAFLLPEMVLTLGALAILVADVLAPARRVLLTSIAIAVLAATLAAIFIYRNADVDVAGGLIAVDGFSTFFKLVFVFAAIMTVLMSHRYLAIEGINPGEYHFLVLCATLGMMVMAGAIDLISAFVGLETMAVSFYVLAGYIKPNPRSNEAAVKYFLLGAFSLAILLYGMSLLYGLSGSTHLGAMADAFGAQPPPQLGNQPGMLDGVQHGDRGELEVREQIDAGVDDVAQRGAQGTMKEAVGHEGSLVRATRACHFADGPGSRGDRPHRPEGGAAPDDQCGPGGMIRTGQRTRWRKDEVVSPWRMSPIRRCPCDPATSRSARESWTSRPSSAFTSP